MVRRTTATDAKSQLLSLLDDVEAGETIEVTRHGRLVARLIPAQGPAASKGSLVGVVMSAASDDELFSTGARWELE